MATRVTLGIQMRGQGDGSGQVLLSDDFDTVFNRIAPVSPPSSALEARQNLVHQTTDGKRMLIFPQHVVLVEEEADDE
jgi:hypothetical protein